MASKRSGVAPLKTSCFSPTSSFACSFCQYSRSPLSSLSKEHLSLSLRSTVVVLFLFPPPPSPTFIILSVSLGLPLVIGASVGRYLSRFNAPPHQTSTSRIVHPNNILLATPDITFSPPTINDRDPTWPEVKENPRVESLREARSAWMEARSSKVTRARPVFRLVLRMFYFCIREPLLLGWLESWGRGTTQEAMAFDPTHVASCAVNNTKTLRADNSSPRRDAQEMSSLSSAFKSTRLFRSKFFTRSRISPKPTLTYANRIPKNQQIWKIYFYLHLLACAFCESDSAC